jgi:hypothetical protein
VNEPVAVSQKQGQAKWLHNGDVKPVLYILDRNSSYF